MDDLQIRNILNGISTFYGVYSADNIPKTIPIGKAIILNTQCRCNKHSGHWLALYRNKDGSITFFDSFGFTPNIYNIDHYVKEWIYDTRRIQSFTSLVCGAYVVTFILAKNNGISLEEYKDNFTEDRLFNDIFIRQFVLKTFNTDIPLFRGKKWW